MEKLKTKLWRLALLFLRIFFLVIPWDLEAQIEGTFDATATWSFNLETPGINLRSYFFLNDKICFGPEFDYFFDKTEKHLEEEVTTSVFAFDFNSHYLFEVVEHRLGAYPIIGLNYTHEKESVEELGHLETHTATAFGLNLGIGLEIPLSERINLFSEYIHTFSSLKDNVLFLGVNYRWSGRDEH